MKKAKINQTFDGSILDLKLIAQRCLRDRWWLISKLLTSYNSTCTKLRNKELYEQIYTCRIDTFKIVTPKMKLILFEVSLNVSMDSVDILLFYFCENFTHISSRLNDFLWSGSKSHRFRLWELKIENRNHSSPRKLFCVKFHFSAKKFSYPRIVLFPVQ